MTAHVHAAGNLVAIGLAVANLVVHWIVANPPLGWVAFALSAATVGTFGLTGYLGGEMTYRYRIGQIAPTHGGEIPDGVATQLLTRRSLG